MAEPKIGISGWRYEPWRGTFYPKGVKQADELRYASEHFDAIEINGSFYSLQSPSSYRRWYEAVPADFCFAVKGSRYITHMRRLKEIETPLANFFASGVLTLKEKLGPFLWQLPPFFPFRPERLRDFFRLLPRNEKEAARLASHHDDRVRGKFFIPTRPGTRRLHHVLEVRHESFVTPEFVSMLRENEIGLVVADTGGRFPFFTATTSQIVYVRLHGGNVLYESKYEDAELQKWARRVRRWRARGLEVFLFFDNDKKVHAPFDAIRLRERLSSAGLSAAGRGVKVPRLRAK